MKSSVAGKFQVSVPNYLAVEVVVTWDKVTEFDKTNIAKGKA
jgi:hypothetical protein